MRGSRLNNMEKIIKYIEKHMNGYASPDHGLKHWRSVEKLGNYLADINGADKKIVTLFAYMHDLGREHDDEDAEHGKRSALIVQELFDKKIINITPEQYKKLIYACQFHPLEMAQSDDITIQTCWDADRLDLWRVGIEPDPKLLFTKEAKTPKIILMAKDGLLG